MVKRFEEEIQPSGDPVDTVMRRNHEVVNFTRSRVKNNSKLTNLMKIIQIEGYNGK